MKIAITILLLSVAFIGSATEIDTHKLEVSYGDRKLPVKVYLPKNLKAAAPLIVYSHGLGGSCETKKYLMEYWTKAGFICMSVQHPGSDESVWKNAKRFQKFKAMKEAASAEQFRNRTKDIPAALDQLEKWNKDPKHPLYQKVDMTKLGMSGHSFGAITSQAMMGAKYSAKQSFEETRFRAFLLMSPSKVPTRLEQTKVFGHITKPVFCMTGTEDTSVIAPGVRYKERAAVYEALPEKNKYQYVFDGGKHNLFSGPNKWRPKLLDEHVIVQKLSLWFWQKHLVGNKEATESLKNFRPPGKDQYLSK
jgi:predicted dienelactone hydrolase